MPEAPDLTCLWSQAFAETHVITVDGHERRLERFFASLPFDRGLVRVDRCAPGRDCLTGAPHANHHLVVGNRHKRLVGEARQRGARNVFVFEDDAEFVGGDMAPLAGALRWARANAHRWDVFYLGFLAPLLSTCAYASRHVVRPSRPFHAHALCYAAPAYDAVIGIDFTRDHRPRFHRAMERVASPAGRRAPYFRDGVGSIDTWLSFSRLRRFAAHPVQVVQHALPPGTEDGWRRRTGWPYDVRQTPRTLVRLAIGAYYLRLGVAVAAMLAAATTVR